MLQQRWCVHCLLYRGLLWPNSLRTEVVHMTLRYVDAPSCRSLLYKTHHVDR